MSAKIGQIICIGLWVFGAILTVLILVFRTETW